MAIINGYKKGPQPTVYELYAKNIQLISNMFMLIILHHDGVKLNVQSKRSESYGKVYDGSRHYGHSSKVR